MLSLCYSHDKVASKYFIESYVTPSDSINGADSDDRMIGIDSTCNQNFGLYLASVENSPESDLETYIDHAFPKSNHRHYEPFINSTTICTK